MSLYSVSDCLFLFFLDRTVQAAGRFLALPLPQHQDLESGKSILIFSIKVKKLPPPQKKKYQIEEIMQSPPLVIFLSERLKQCTVWLKYEQSRHFLIPVKIKLLFSLIYNIVITSTTEVVYLFIYISVATRNDMHIVSFFRSCPNSVGSSVGEWQKPTPPIFTFSNECFSVRPPWVRGFR